MAVTSLRTNVWDSPDGLRVYFPGTGHVVTRGGEVDNTGRHWVEVVVDLTTLPDFASGNQQMIAENVLIPKGAQIEQVDVVTTVGAVSSGSATLNVGLVRQDRTTELDFDGLVALLAKTAIDTVGETVELRVGSTGAGALVGTKLANSGYLVAYPGTANFSAGKVMVRVFWSMPGAADM